jgi:hypothetical protein
LHNVYTNARNGRQSVLDFAAYLPLERVWELHMAGGMERDGFYLDAHSGKMDSEMLEVSAQVIAQIPNLKAIIYEIFPSFIEIAGLACVEQQMEELHRLWALRGTRHLHGQQRRTDWQAAPEMIAPAEWENSIGALVNHHAPTDGAPAPLREAECVPLIKGLIEEFRASMLVGLYPLSTRLMMLILGRDVFQSLLEAFWQQHAPEQYALREADHFVAFLRGLDLRMPSLEAVLRFEEAAMLTLTEGQEHTVQFDFDPIPLFRSLAEGRLPESDSALGDYAITLTPDGVSLTSSLEGLRQGMH